MRNNSWLVGLVAIITIMLAVAVLGWLQPGGRSPWRAMMRARNTGYPITGYPAMMSETINKNMGVSTSYAPGMAEIAPLAPDQTGALGQSVDGRNMTSPIWPAPWPSETVRGGEMLLQEANMSVVSSDPGKTEQDIRRITQEMGGFLLTSQVNRPEEGATATVVVRVPSDKLQDALTQFAAAGQRVLSTEIHGQDITQQYQDIEAKLTTLAATRAKLEDLLDAAREVDDILLIQQHLNALQDQKDALEGQKRYLAEASKLSRVTLYIASDELALPYAPAEPWRPQAIFKMAVRSVVGTLRGVGTLAIWALVYLPLVLILALPIWWLMKRRVR